MCGVDLFDDRMYQLPTGRISRDAPHAPNPVLRSVPR